MSRPRIRSIKPEMWHDEAFGGLTPNARLLFVGLITMADDEGRLRDLPAAIIGHVFPYDAVPVAKVDRWLEELSHAALIERYDVGAYSYVALRSWSKHQKVNRPTPSRLPTPPSVTTHGNLTERSVNGHGGRTEDSQPRARARPGRSDQDQDLSSLRSDEGASPPVDGGAVDRARDRIKGASIQRVFDTWVRAADKDPKRTQLDAKRRRLIRRALEAYPEVDVLDAVQGWRNSSHHRGETNGTVYNDLGLLLRDGEHIEKFRDLQRGDNTVAPAPPTGADLAAAAARFHESTTA
jgi:hypothetical protein